MDNVTSRMNLQINLRSSGECWPLVSPQNWRGRNILKRTMLCSHLGARCVCVCESERNRSTAKNSTSHFFYMSEGGVSTPMLALKFSRSSRMAAIALEQKGLTQHGVTYFAGFIWQAGVRMFINNSDEEPAMKALKDAAAKALKGVESISQESPVGDHQANGDIESTVRTLKAQMRATRFALGSRLGRQLAHYDPILLRIPNFAGDTIARFRKGPDGKTPWEREQGRKLAGASLEFGERFFMKEAKERASGAFKRDCEQRLIEARYLGQHARTGAMIGITTHGIVCGRLGRRLPEAERWDQTGWQDLKGVSWDLRPTGVPEPEVDVEGRPGEAEAEQRERRWQRPRREIRTSQAERRNAPRRSARETSQIRRAIFSTCISVRCS